MAVKSRFIFVNRFFYPDHSSTAQILADLAFDLVRRGDKVAVITSRLRYDDPSLRLPAYEKIDGVEIHRVATTGFGRATLIGRAIDLASFYVTAFIALLQVARAGDLIVAKTDPPLLSILVQPAAWLKRARFMTWMQDVYPEVASAAGIGILGGPLGRLLTAWRNVSLRAAHRNIVIGERMRMHLLAAKVPAEQIRIIANWSDEKAIFPVPHEENELRAQWGLNGKFVVAYSGNLGRAHEYQTMLAAASSLRSDPRIVFLMIGGGHYTNALRAEAQSAGLSNIVFQPYQPLSALAASLSAGDLHWVSLVPEFEGLIVPSKVYGTLAAGRPILAVTEAEGEISRIVSEHQCGAQVEIGDHQAFADFVRKLADNPALARSMGEAARRAATTSCSRAMALTRWREALIASAPAPSTPHVGGQLASAGR